MYRHFASLEELFAHMREDKHWTGANAAVHDRYPIRFVLFENFADFNDFILNRPDGIYKHSIETMIDPDYQDCFLSYTELSREIRAFAKKIPVNDFVIYPFSEMARFYDNSAKHEFDTLVTTIRGVEAPEDAQGEHVRIYIPVVGMQAKMGRFFDDPNAFVWELSASANRGTYTLVVTDGTTYGVSGLGERYTVVRSLSEWLRLWEKGQGVKPTIICSSANIYANAHHAQPDNAFTYVQCANAYQFLTRALGFDFGVTVEPDAAEMPYWEQLASLIDVTTFSFDDFVKERLDTFTLASGTDFIKAWMDCDTDFDRWLLTVYFRKVSGGVGYVNRAVAQCANLSKAELFSNIATLIFTDTHREASIPERREAMALAAKHGVKITDDARGKLKAKLRAIAVDASQGGYPAAVRLLTPLTDEEQQLAIEWLARNLIRLPDIKDVFPSLYHYMQPIPAGVLEGESQWVAAYMDAYRRSKIANATSDQVTAILAERNGSPAAMQQWMDSFKTVRTVLHNREDIDVVYWIDGLGVDWIPLIRHIVSLYAKEHVYLNEVHVAVASLPTTTSNNRPILQSLLPEGTELPKIGDLDGYAHSAKSYPQYIIDEIAIVEEAIKKVLDEYNGKKIAFVSDHGLTYLSQFESGMKLGGIEANHEGRMAQITCGKLSNDNKYVVLEDGSTVCALTHKSLADKVNKGHGAHGGCTPEEVLVPIIVVSSHENATTYAVTILNDELKASDPVLRVNIRGVEAIDVPAVEYNGVIYPLNRESEGIYRSEPMTLVDTATRVTVRVNDKPVGSYSVKISTGAEEEDLFGDDF